MVTVRYCIRIGARVSNFLNVRETSDLSLVIARRGLRHAVELDSPDVGSYYKDASVATAQSISVHPSFRSVDRRITITGKQERKGVRTAERAEVLGVRGGSLIYPVFGSIGSNVGRPRLLLAENFAGGLTASGTTLSEKSMMLELWPGRGIDLGKQALGFFFFVVWPKVDVPLPAKQPIWMVRARFSAMDLCCFYWTVGLPTRYRGINVTYPTTAGPAAGWEVNRILESIDHLEATYRAKYESLPLLLPDV